MHVLKMILAGLEFTSLLIAIIAFTGLLAVVYFFYQQLEKEKIKRANKSGNKRTMNQHRAFYESLITALIIFITVMLLLSTCGRL